MSPIYFFFEKIDYRNPCNFLKPFEIGNFSLDGERVFRNDDRQLKWCFFPTYGWIRDNSPDLNWDLNAGYSQAIKKNYDVLEKGEPLLKWMLHHQEKIHRLFRSPESMKPKIDFVLSRGLLTKIGSTLYEKRTDWSFCASKFKSVIYMVEFETDKHLEERHNASEITQRMISWGVKFEQFMTCDKPDDTRPNTSIPVNEREEYFIVLKGQMNEYTLLYNAEVDCKDPRHPQSYTNNNDDFKSTDCYIELKTTKNTSLYRGYYFRLKLQKWWLQSFLGGIPIIVCGYRDDEGIVQKLEAFDVPCLPEMGQGDWNNFFCLNLCYHVLQFVKKCVLEDNPDIVYMFKYKRSNYVTCEKLNSPPGVYKVLPEWFTTKFNI